MIKCLIAILSILMGLASCKNKERHSPADLESSGYIEAPTETIAGDAIIIKAAKTEDAPFLKLWNSIGSTVIEGTISDEITQYIIPSPYHKVSGALHYCIGDSCGEIDIMPSKELASLEGYIGPTTAVAGEKSSYMMVGIATDRYDNTVNDLTAITAKNYLKGNLSRTILHSHHGIVKALYDSGPAVGSASMSLSHKAVTTQEYKVAIGPNVAQPFSIIAITEHNKADGNSLLSISTDLIDDTYGNAIADGSLVNWSINGTESQSVLNSYTIGGRSTVEIIHPTQAETLEIQASIGESYSNTIIQQFERGLQSYQVVIENHIVKIGPMVSYLGQFIPDGFPVEIRIVADEQIVLDWLSLQSKDGYAHYDISAHVNNQNAAYGQHSIELRSGGISQSLQVNKDE